MKVEAGITLTIMSVSNNAGMPFASYLICVPVASCLTVTGASCSTFPYSWLLACLSTSLWAFLWMKHIVMVWYRKSWNLSACLPSPDHSCRAQHNTLVKLQPCFGLSLSLASTFKAAGSIYQMTVLSPWQRSALPPFQLDTDWQSAQCFRCPVWEQKKGCVSCLISSLNFSQTVFPLRHQAID